MITNVVIEAKNVTKIFKEESNNTIKIVEDSSFSIKKGELVAFVGPSGCGKSTLLQICGLLDGVTKGDILINNTSTYRLKEHEKTTIRRNNIGFVYQMHHLFPEFTALENVMLPQMIVNKESKKNIENKAKKLLMELGLENRIKHIPAELSGGERQRVAIARALINNPSIVLADEPTGNLDAENSEKTINILLNSLKKIGASLLMVTHDMNIAKKSDRIITIRDRKIETIVDTVGI
jgi:lipoprotein-releasing system ATP-binding protein